MSSVSENCRWLVTLTYASENGPLAIDYAVEELDEIADIVERGPDWNSLIGGSFKLQLVTDPGMTVEKAIMS